jgi:arsenite methyltransferase
MRRSRNCAACLCCAAERALVDFHEFSTDNPRSSVKNLEVVKDYYGKVLKSSKDLKTSACCDGGNVPAELEALLANVHEEVRAKYYGCGIVVPQALRGARVLDLGSGSGRDVYLISQLVGPEGEVVGVDMTDEQLATAEAHADWHMRAFGYSRRNVKFLKGYIENSASSASRPQASTRSCRIA